MLNQFEVFFAQPKIQAVTLSLCIASLFLLAPLLQRRTRSKLTVRQKALYDPVAKDVLFQTRLLFAGVVAYSIFAIVRSDLSFISGDALPFVCFLGSGAAFWNIRRAVLALRSAEAKSNDHRKLRVAEIRGRSITAYTAGLVSFVYGTVTVIAVQLVPDRLPSWLWFISFLMTGPAVYSLSWSIAAFAVATEYAKNPKLGRSNPASRRTGSATG